MVLSNMIAVEHPPQPVQPTRHTRQPQLSATPRRAVLALAPLLASFGTLPAHADDGLASATFTAGDPRFLQPVFDEIKYMGVKGAEVGSVGEIKAVRVTYDANKVPYKKIVGTFWRSCDPTAEAQFGDQGPTIIWVPPP